MQTEITADNFLVQIKENPDLVKEMAEWFIRLPVHHEAVAAGVAGTQDTIYRADALVWGCC
ncbi:MAG: hypothetical protein ACYC7E_20030 [Armatimonadota bacterium]